MHEGQLLKQSKKQRAPFCLDIRHLRGLHVVNLYQIQKQDWIIREMRLLDRRVDEFNFLLLNSVGCFINFNWFKDIYYSLLFNCLLKIILIFCMFYALRFYFNKVVATIAFIIHTYKKLWVDFKPIYIILHNDLTITIILMSIQLWSIMP